MLVSSVSGPRFPGANAGAYTLRCCATTFSTRPTMSTISIQPAPGLSGGPDFNRYLSERRPHFLNPATCASMPISLPPGLSQGHARNDDQMDVARIFYMKGI